MRFMSQQQQSRERYVWYKYISYPVVKRVQNSERVIIPDTRANIAQQKENMRSISKTEDSRQSNGNPRNFGNAST